MLPAIKRHLSTRNCRGYISPGSIMLLGSLAILVVAFFVGAHVFAKQEQRELMPKLKAELPKENADWQMLKSSDDKIVSARYIMKSDVNKYVTITFMAELGDIKPVYDMVQKIPLTTPADTKINATNLIEYVKGNRAVYGGKDNQNYVVIFVGSLAVMIQAQGLSKDMLMNFANTYVPCDQLAAMDHAQVVPPFLR
jgi:hypothetical protein